MLKDTISNIWLEDKEGDTAGVLHLYMKGTNPVLEKIMSMDYKKGKFYSGDMTDYLTGCVLREYSKFIVKEVYILYSDNRNPVSGKTIFRKNSDGEYTVTIY